MRVLTMVRSFFVRHGMERSGLAEVYITKAWIELKIIASFVFKRCLRMLEANLSRSSLLRMPNVVLP